MIKILDVKKLFNPRCQATLHESTTPQQADGVYSTNYLESRPKGRGIKSTSGIKIS